MVKTNQCCIEHDKILTEEVRQYPCLYEKSSLDYKDTLIKNNAWAKMDEKSKKEVESSRHDWEVLLDRCSRKRMRHNSLNVSGTGRDKIVQAEKSLEEYRFLQWYTAFIRQKKSKSNIPEVPVPAKDIDLELLENKEDCSRSEYEEDCEKEYTSLKETNSSSKKLSPASEAGKQSSSSGSKQMANINVLSEITAFLKFKLNKSASVDSAGDLFGKMVAAESKQIPDERKRVIKPEMTTILYRYQTSTCLETSESLPVREQPHRLQSSQATSADCFLHPQNILTPVNVPGTFFNS